ncbi:MAG: GntR family transcriptional regulator [Burkholderiales bacterium]|nr:GntR family transcriptional regulator [Burkholderiales bacterium]
MSTPRITPPAAPPRRRGASGTAYSWLRGEILSGRMRPGQTLSESEIALRLGVSRTPVREAIVGLESEGLLTVRPQVGTAVAPIDVEAVADGQFVREAIECRTVALAARRVRPTDARDLKNLLDRQARGTARGDHAALVRLDDELHRRLCEIAGRPGVWRAVENVKAQFDRVRFLSLEDPAWHEAIYRQHEAIVERVVAGDATGAASAMSTHLNAVFESIATIARANPAFFHHPQP